MNQVSLITGTLGRPEQLERLLRSLRSQTLVPLEVILVDQGTGDEMAALVARYSSELPIRHLHCEPGLSQSLNHGLEIVKGNIVGFPDDDCWYSPDVLAQISGEFDAHSNWDGITAKCVDGGGLETGIRWSRRGGKITRYNAWFRGMSTGIFLRTEAAKRVGGFDVELGVGPNKLLASHDTDFLIRASAAGLHVEYVPEIMVGHPQMISAGVEGLAKSYQYAVGAGRLMRKHRLPWWFFGSALALPAVRSMAARITGCQSRAKLEWSSVAGRWRGWRGGNS